MELLNYPKGDYLLDAPLDLLHGQSVQWLNELRFWSDEMTFFYRMLHHKKMAGVFPSSQLADIDKQLVKLNGEDLENVKNGVQSHERLLAAVYRSASLAEEQIYREAHKKLLDEMRMLEQSIRTFKRRVFSFVTD